MGLLIQNGYLAQLCHFQNCWLLPKAASQAGFKRALQNGWLDITALVVGIYGSK